MANPMAETAPKSFTVYILLWISGAIGTGLFNYSVVEEAFTAKVIIEDLRLYIQLTIAIISVATLLLIWHQLQMYVYLHEFEVGIEDTKFENFLRPFLRLKVEPYLRFFCLVFLLSAGAKFLVILTIPEELNLFGYILFRKDEISKDTSSLISSLLLFTFLVFYDVIAIAKLKLLSGKGLPDCNGKKKLTADDSRYFKTLIFYMALSDIFALSMYFSLIFVSILDEGERGIANVLLFVSGIAYIIVWVLRFLHQKKNPDRVSNNNSETSTSITPRSQHIQNKTFNIVDILISTAIIFFACLLIWGLHLVFYS